jgi:hypothetical protein
VLSTPEDGSTAGFPNAVLHQKLDDGQSPKQESDVTESFCEVQITNIFIAVFHILLFIPAETCAMRKRNTSSGNAEIEGRSNYEKL